MSILMPKLSAINLTNVVDPTHGPGLSPVPNSPPPEVHQTANLDHPYDGVVDALYRQYGPSLIRLVPN
jgi:hypothetical protein